MDSRLTCVFWNVNRRDRRALVCALAAENNADVVVLAEHDADSDATLDQLRGRAHETFVGPHTETWRLQLFARSHTLDMREVYGDLGGRVTIRTLLYEQEEFLFAAAHLPSKVNWNRADQAAEARELAHQIRSEEEKRGHRRTILVGDLNMNPFEDGIVQAGGLHAMMAKSTVMAGSRTVQGKEYPFFYNPMWAFFGDRTKGPPGTLYYRNTGHISYDWNIFDQVLIRPDVLPWFEEDVEIITKIGDTELVDTLGRPNSEVGSDHFPIVFRLKSTD